MRVIVRSQRLESITLGIGARRSYARVLATKRCTDGQSEAAIQFNAHD